MRSSMFEMKYTAPYPVASGRMSEPPQFTPLPVNTPVNSLRRRLYWPNMYPISRAPTPMSPAGTSVSAPTWRVSSVMKLWQKRITSRSDFPFGSKSEPPLPPPIGNEVKEFLKICSKPKNFKMLRFTLGWKRRPPLYGPIAELNCTRKPRFTCTWPLSSTHGTRKIMVRSGSTMRSKILASAYFGFFSMNGITVSATSSTA